MTWLKYGVAYDDWSLPSIAMTRISSGLAMALALAFMYTCRDRRTSCGSMVRRTNSGAQDQRVTYLVLLMCDLEEVSNCDRPTPRKIVAIVQVKRGSSTRTKTRLEVTAVTLVTNTRLTTMVASHPRPLLLLPRSLPECAYGLATTRAET